MKTKYLDILYWIAILYHASYMKHFVNNKGDNKNEHYRNQKLLN